MPVLTFLVEESLAVLAILSLCLKSIPILVSGVGFLFSKEILPGFFCLSFCGHAA